MALQQQQQLGITAVIKQQNSFTNIARNDNGMLIAHVS